MVGFSFSSKPTDNAAPQMAPSALKKSVSFAPGTAAAATSTPATGGLFSIATPSQPASSLGNNSSAQNAAVSSFGFRSTVGTPAFGFNAASASTTSPGLGFGSYSTNVNAGPVGGSFGIGGTTGGTNTSSFMETHATLAGPTLTTKYDKLPQDIRNKIQEFGKYVKEQSQIDLEIKSASESSLFGLNSIIEDFYAVVIALKNNEDRQNSTIKSIKNDVKALFSDGETAGNK